MHIKCICGSANSSVFLRKVPYRSGTDSSLDFFNIAVRWRFLLRLVTGRPTLRHKQVWHVCGNWRVFSLYLPQGYAVPRCGRFLQSTNGFMVGDSTLTRPIGWCNKWTSMNHAPRLCQRNCVWKHSLSYTWMQTHTVGAHPSEVLFQARAMGLCDFWLEYVFRCPLTSLVRNIRTILLTNLSTKFDTKPPIWLACG